MIVPTIGRVVWYQPHANDTIRLNSDQALAALVTYVHSDRMVNLVVFDPNGVPSPRTSVTLRQEGDGTPSWSYCEWMPYQIGQAKKHEGAAAGLAPGNGGNNQGAVLGGSTGSPIVSTSSGDHI